MKSLSILLPIAIQVIIEKYQSCNPKQKKDLIEKNIAGSNIDVYLCKHLVNIFQFWLLLSSRNSQESHQVELALMLASTNLLLINRVQ